MELLAVVQTLEAAGIFFIGLLDAYWLTRNASRLQNGKRGLRFTKALTCFLLALVYAAGALGAIDVPTLSLYARPLLLMLLITLLGREWLERMP